MKRKLQAIVGTLVLVGAATVEATTIRRLANEELTNDASLIVMGRVVESKSQWLDRNLITLATVEVSSALKGEPGQRITVALPGGIDSHRKFPVAMTYAGAPTLADNENVLLFLVRGEDLEPVDAYAIEGFAQGKFSILEDAEGVKRVSRDLTRVDVQDENGVTRGTRTLQPLSEFLDEIRGHLQRGR
jgi:hypothetical protein